MSFEWAQAVVADERVQLLLGPARTLLSRTHQPSFTTLLWVCAAAFCFLLYYLCAHVRRPHLLYARTPLNGALVGSLWRLREAFWPTPYLTHEVAQAAVGSFVRFDPRIKRDKQFEREVRRMADGELLALDWLHPTPSADGTPVPEDAPVVFVCHGLAGHTDELNMQYLALEIRNAGARFALLNRRGCALDMMLQNSHMYEYGCTSDMREVLHHIKRRYPRAPLLGVGYSAGSNLLTKYLGETGTDSLLDAGMSVANGFDVQETSKALHAKPFYAGIMVNILQNLLARNEATFKRVQQRHEHEEAEEAAAAAAAAAASDPEGGVASSSTVDAAPRRRRRTKLNLARVKRVKTVLEWDREFSMATCGGHYDSLDDFYAAQSTTPELIARIARPLLCIYARDDPIIPSHVVPDRALLSNPRVIQATTHRGGHLGFAEGFFPFDKASWMEKLTGDWVRATQMPHIAAMIAETRVQAQQEADMKAAALEAAQAAAAPPAASHVMQEEERKSSISASQQSEVDTPAHAHHAAPSHAGGDLNAHGHCHGGHSRSHSHGGHGQQHSHSFTVAGHTRTRSHPLAPAPLLSLLHSSQSHASFRPHAAAGAAAAAAAGGVGLPPLHPSAAMTEEQQAQSLHSQSLLPELSFPEYSVARFQQSPVTPTLVDRVEQMLQLQRVTSEDSTDTGASSQGPDASPMLPLTPQPQPHRYAFMPAAPTVIAMPPQAVMPSSAVAQSLSHELHPQHDHSVSMEFSLDHDADDASSERKESPATAAAAASALASALSPTKRRKLDATQHARGPSADAESEAPAASTASAHSPDRASLHPVHSTTLTPLKRKK